MERTQKKLRLCIVLLVCNVIFIWGNSLLPGELSGAISDFVKDLVYKLLPGTSGAGEGGHGLLRKAAHFTEFACLGALLCWLAAMLGKPRALAMAVAFLTACADETIQRFVPDRGPAFKDVLIDTSGAITGMILLLVGYAFVTRKKQAMEDKK
jgi:VanZ family protein